MPVNDFSVGRDITLDIITPQGPARFKLRKTFAAKQDTNDIREKGLDGIVRHLILPDGWSGTFEFARQDAEVDRFFSRLENDYFAGLNIPAMTITETISEPTGARSQFRYEGVMLKLDDAGEWKGDSTVPQRISWVASRRRQVA